MIHESFLSEFQIALTQESVGGNAGQQRAAVNISIDPRTHAWVCTNYPEVQTDFVAIVRLPKPAERGLPTFITEIVKQSQLANSLVRELFLFASTYNQAQKQDALDNGVLLPNEPFFQFVLPNVKEARRQ